MTLLSVDKALALGTSDRALALLTLPEDQWFERKSNRVAAQDLANVMIGFANAEGGTIVIGLHDGEVEGLHGAVRRVPQWQQAALDFTVPAAPCRTRTVACVNAQGEPDRLLVVEVETSDKVHANRKDEVYLRVGDETRRLGFNQRQELLYDKGQSTFESTRVREADAADLDRSLLREYARTLGHPEPIRLLVARGLLSRSGDPTVASILLFARTPQTWFPEAGVRILRYHGNERGTGTRQRLSDDMRIDEAIPRQLVDARDAITQFIPTRRALTADGRFDVVPLIPRDAWLEGLVNAVIHRSYSVSGDHIRIEIFDDRIEIESPGRFPGISDAGDPLNMTRFARNPRIARVSADLGFGQELGEGIRRMYEEMRLAGLADPLYRQTSGSVKLTLSSDPVDRALDARMPEDARDLIRIIRESGRASTGDIVEATGRSRPIVIRQLKALQEARIIDWIGKSQRDPRAHWVLHIDRP